MSRLAINGVELNVELSGQGQPLLLLHGFTGSSANWQSYHETLGRQFQLIAVDLLGHGLSEAPADPARHNLDHSATDLAAILDRLAIPKAAVLGYSMGGRIAL